MYVLCCSGYEPALVGSMAAERTVCDLKGFKRQLEGLLSRYSRDELCSETERFCSDFCTLVEEHAARWQLPLPQLRVLEIALCYFARASSCFPSNCDPALQTISSLALSVFELLLFFDQNDFSQEPLERFTATFQECHLVLVRLQNLPLLQVERLVVSGGPWASPVLQAILSQSSLPQHEVDAYIGSELPIFFELRVRFLLSRSRFGEAAALAKRCIRHPSTGQHLFFLQVYLTWLHKTSQQDCLHKEVADVSGKDAVHILCSLESDEKDELLLALSTAFLTQQLRRGDMYYLCDLVLVWTNLHGRLKTPPQVLLAECRQLMKSATNVKSIFPFIRAVLQNVGEAGIQFCIELCANALQARLPCDVTTKSLIYKTIAGLLPNDLEVCRACALLVFFQERTVESYKMVYLLYMLPDQEYHAEDSPIGNHVRFETLQVLKKDLHFDPEFWNLITLRSNCLKLMNKKVASPVLEEIMEDRWISKYCAKDPAPRSGCHAKDKSKKRLQNQSGADSASKRLKTGTGKTRHDERAAKRKGARTLQESSARSLRRSFWQLDRIHGSVALRYEEQRRTTRLSEKNPPKRRIRRPRWLLEDSGALEENVPVRIKRNGLKRGKCLPSCVMKRAKMGPMKSAKPLGASQLKANHGNQNGFPSDAASPPSPPQVILELSLPDNELMATFTEDACHRPRGFPQVLFYRPTVKRAAAPSPEKTAHGKEVILRARDPGVFVQQLHCYAHRHKGKGPSSHVHASVSTITRSSLHGSPPKGSPRDQTADTGAFKAPSMKPPTRKGGAAREEHNLIQDKGVFKAPGDLQNSSKAETLPSPKPQEAPRSSSSEPCEDVEMKVTIASQSPVPTAGSELQSEENRPQKTKVSEVNRPVRINIPTAEDQVLCRDGEEPLRTLSSQGENPSPAEAEQEQSDGSSRRTQSEPEDSHDPSLQDRPGDMVVPALSPERVPQENKREPAEHSTSGEPSPEVELSRPEEARTPLSAPPLHNIKEEATAHEIGFDPPEGSEFRETFPESEESRLEYCCIFCEKDFRGCRVVAHAMFHYRKDECMFCGTVFTDDLLAMIHLSDHIEKLKRLQGPAAAATAADGETKDSSAKAKTSDTSPTSGKRGRPRKSFTPQKRTDSGPSEPRTLRSDHKQSQRPQTPHRVNGHVSKKFSRTRCSVDAKEEPVQQEISPGPPGSEAGSSTSIRAARKLACLKEEKTTEPPKVNKKTSKEKSVDAQEMACCPVDGCSWSADISKNRVAPLYHALEDHYGDATPLRLAFRVGNGKCSICSRVMFSFEHFLHHVGRHRDSPRHPCLHQGCDARFKSGMEMRRHARRHSPLQAVCCLPGCSQLFICLWALNLHEKEHFCTRPVKPMKTANVQTQAGRKRRCSEEASGDPAASDVPAGKTRQDEARQSPLRESAKVQKDGKDSQVPKDLSSQEDPKQPSVPRLRLRRPSSEAHRAPPSLALKHRSKVRRKLKKLQVRTKSKRPRGRPLKASKTTNGENLRSARNPSQVKTTRSSADDSSADLLRVTKLRDHRKPPSKKHPAKLHKIRNHHTLSKTKKKRARSEDGSSEKKLSASATAQYGAEASSPDAAAGPAAAEKQSEKVAPTTEKKLEEQEKTSAPKQMKLKLHHQDDSMETAGTQKGGVGESSTLPSADAPPSADASVSPAPPDIQQRKNEKSATIEKQTETKLKKKSRDGATSAASTALQTESPAGHAPDADAPAPAHTINGKTSGQLQRTSVCSETLALYSKKPYLRVPPTAYLDEKYTAMPKRRKTSLLPPPPNNVAAPEKTSAAPQRQRCAKCFATFTCAEELRGHLQRQNCSKLFGFDSDEEEEADS